MHTKVFIRSFVTASMATAVAVMAMACGSDTPASPTSTTTSTPTTQSVASGPAISSVGPASPNAVTGTQSFVVTGTGFTPGISLILKGPGTGATLYGPRDLSSITDTSFTATVSIAVAGEWTATVRGEDGKDSVQFPFTAHVTPAVSAVNPATVTHKTSMQTVTVTGANFLPGLSFVMKGPDTGAVKYSGSSVGSVSGSSFSATAMFPVAGTWTVTVMNPDGYTSTEVAFVVK